MAQESPLLVSGVLIALFFPRSSTAMEPHAPVQSEATTSRRRRRTSTRSPSLDPQTTPLLPATTWKIRQLDQCWPTGSLSVGLVCRAARTDLPETPDAYLPRLQLSLFRSCGKQECSKTHWCREPLRRRESSSQIPRSFAFASGSSSLMG